MWQRLFNTQQTRMQRKGQARQRLFFSSFKYLWVQVFCLHVCLVATEGIKSLELQMVVS